MRRTALRQCSAFSIATVRFLTLVLRSLTEAENNQRGLVAPVLWALSDIAAPHPEWTRTRRNDAIDDIDSGETGKLAPDACRSPRGCSRAGMAVRRPQDGCPCSAPSLQDDIGPALIEWAPRAAVRQLGIPPDILIGVPKRYAGRRQFHDLPWDPPAELSAPSL